MDNKEVKVDFYQVTYFKAELCGIYNGFATAETLEEAREKFIDLTKKGYHMDREINGMINRTNRNPLVVTVTSIHRKTFKLYKTKTLQKPEKPYLWW